MLLRTDNSPGGQKGWTAQLNINHYIVPGVDQQLIKMLSKLEETSRNLHYLRSY
jgi:hypothetical protein